VIWLAGCSGSSVPEQPLTITEARIRTVVPGQDKTVAYFTLENRGSEAFVLTGAESAAARAIEIHVVERDGDMVRMRRLQAVTIAPGSSVRFEPGGRHLMVFGVSDLVEPVTITLIGAGDERLTADFTLIGLGAD
jgi:copper(I)-binding protein